MTESSVWIASIFEQFNEFSRNSIKNFGYLLEVVQYTEKLFLFFKLQNYHFGSVNDLEVSSPWKLFFVFFFPLMSNKYIFCYLKKKNILFSKYLDFCISDKSTKFKISKKSLNIVSFTFCRFFRTSSSIMNFSQILVRLTQKHFQLVFSSIVKTGNSFQALWRIVIFSRWCLLFLYLFSAPFHNSKTPWTHHNWLL